MTIGPPDVPSQVRAARGGAFGRRRERVLPQILIAGWPRPTLWDQQRLNPLPPQRLGGRFPEGILSRAHSYRITLSNNRTEKEAVEHLRVHDPRVRVPDKSGRRALMDYFEIPKHLSRAFDLVRLPDGAGEGTEIPESLLADVELVEVKSTKKLLPKLPYGFFFGATANEFEIAELLGPRFKFCFVCLNPDSFGICYLSLPELEPLIRTRRVQYQVNLLSSPRPQ